MERSLRQRESRERADFASTYDLEQQLKVAERRYEEARAAGDKAREELRALTIRPSATAQAVQVARTRFDALAARCTRLRDLIDALEERLEG